MLPLSEESAVRRARPWLVHVPFALLIVVSLIPRVIAMVGYRPVLMFFGDSQSYLYSAQSGELIWTRPFGYSAFLRLLSWTHYIGSVSIIQHLAIIVLAVALYITLIELKAPVWLAVAVPAPMLLDGYQILIEHVAMTEVLFTCLVMGALLVAIRRKFTVGSGLVVGVLMAAASLTRTVAIPIVAIAVAYLVVRRVGWKPVVACVGAFTLPVIAYCGLFYSAYGSFTIQRDGRFLYARVAPIADCSRLTLSPPAQQLCDATPVSTRPGSNFYAWDRSSPFNKIPIGTARSAEAAEREIIGREFGMAVIKQQPVDYARLVLRDLGHYFSPGRFASYQDTPPSWWSFPRTAARADQQIVLSGSNFADDKADVSLQSWAATFLRGWQSILGTQGLFLLLCLLLGVAGAVFGKRRKGGARRIDSLLFAATGTALIAIPSATSVFDYRYALPAAVPLYAAAGWGLLLLLQARELAEVDEQEAAELTAAEAVAAKNRHRARNRLTPWLTTAAFTVIVGAIIAAPIQRAPGYLRYVSTGAERGALGYSKDSIGPLESQRDWTIRNFEGGSIYVSPVSNTYVVTAETMQAYADGGGAAVFGLPITGTSVLRRASGESVTWFERGAIVVSKARGARSVLPPLLDEWCFPASPCQLGAPLANAESQADGTRIQRFTGGTLSVRPDGTVEQSDRKPSSDSSEKPVDAVLPPDVRGD